MTRLEDLSAPTVIPQRLAGAALQYPASKMSLHRRHLAFAAISSLSIQEQDGQGYKSKGIKNVKTHTGVDKVLRRRIQRRLHDICIDICLQYVSYFSKSSTTMVLDIADETQSNVHGRRLKKIPKSFINICNGGDYQIYSQK